MPTASFDVINTVQRRLRDVLKFAYPDTAMVRLVDHVQRLLQAADEMILTTVAGIATTPGTTLYQVSALAGLPVNATRVVRVEWQGRSLPRVPWRALVQSDPGWLRRIDTSLALWAEIGLDLLVLYPALAVPDTVTLTVVTPTAGTIVNTVAVNDMTIPDDNIPLLQDLVEALGTIRGRRAGEGADPLTRVREALQRLEQANADAQSEG